MGLIAQISDRDNPRQDKSTDPRTVIIGCWRYPFTDWMTVLNIAIEHGNYLFFRHEGRLHAVFTDESQWGNA